MRSNSLRSNFSKLLKSASVLLTGLVFSQLALAEVVVDHPYARAVPPGQSNSAAFMDLQNNSRKQVALISASTSVAGSVELHTHRHTEDGTMQMRQIPQVTMFAKERVVLKPGGHHIMLIGLKKPLAEGDVIDLTLNFDDGSSQQLEVPVKSVISALGEHHTH